MQIIRLIPLLGFLLFCLQIGIRAFVLKQKEVKLSAPKRDLKTTALLIVLCAFFLVFLTELISKAGLIHFSFVPDELQPLLFGKIMFAIGGVVLLLPANLLMLLALRTLNQSLRFGLDRNNAGKLVTTGIYAHTRNPFFLAVNCLFIGVAMVFPTPFFIAIGLLTPVFIHFFILKEEQFMHENYGEEYKNYCQKVRRYF